MPQPLYRFTSNFSLLPALFLALFVTACGGGTTAPAPPSVANSAPVLDAIGNQTVSENTTAITNVSGSDADGNALTYSLSGADAASFTLASSGGALAFSEAPNFESPASENGDNVYEVTVSVSDGSQSDSESITVTVTDVLDILTGRVVDGPISNALCRVVVDDMATSDETFTDQEGVFSFSDVIAGANTEVHCSGGIDTATGNDLTGLVLVTEVTAGTAVANVNAITTVLSTVDGEEEKQAILDELGIGGTPEALVATDIWGDSETGDTGAQHAQRINAQLSILLQTTVTIVNEATGDSVDSTAISKAVVEQVVQATNEAGDSVNLSDPDVVNSIILDAVETVAPAADVAPAVINAVSNAVADVNALLGDETENPTSDTAADIAAVAQTGLQASVSDVAGGQIDVDTFQQESNLENLFPGDGTSTDTTPPDITLIGDSKMTWEGANAWVDPGYSAIDDKDGAVEVTVSGTVNTTALGAYTLTYTATDEAGNEAAEVQRVVTVVDTTPPTVTLLGSASMTLAHDDQYEEQGATAFDSLDGDLDTVREGSVGSAPETYTLTYSATDLSGNSSQKTRFVTVEAEPEDPPPTGGDDPTDQLVFKNGVVDGLWDGGINGWDEHDYSNDCSNDGGAACPNIAWEVINDSDRGDVLQITHAGSSKRAGLYFSVTGDQGVDLTGFQNGHVEFDIKVVSGDANITMKLDCYWPCSSGDQNLGPLGVNGWESVAVPFTQLTPDLDLTKVNTGLVIWATNFGSTVFRIDNVRFTGFDEDAEPPTNPPPSVDFKLTPMGLGSYSDTINPASYRCAEDYGFWLYNAGVIGATDLGTCARVEDAQPVKKMPQVAGAAANKHTMTHRWWGSIPFAAEAYITPDPIMARLSGTGVRITGIPSGLRVFTSMPGCGADDPPCVDIVENNFGYVIPAPADEVMEAIAIGNTNHGGMTTKLLDYSEGSVTAGWFAGSSLIMEATFVQGSPYVYFEVHSGLPVVKTLPNPNGDQRLIWHQDDESLGISTNVAGMRNHFLVVGDAGTSFDNVDSEAVTVNSPSNAFTLAWMPTTGESVADSLRDSVKRQSRNVVDKVQIDYSVDRGTNTVSVTHRYLDNSDQTVDTLAGLMPMAWKRAESLTAVASVRSARGVIKYAEQSSFTYDLPSVGVLPSLPVVPGSLDENHLRTLVDDFVVLGPSSWNTADDTYWNGKAVGRLAEVLALANQLGMTEATSTLLDWLKGELADWMSAERDGTLDHINYFVYDDDWNTLLGMDEAFYSHALLQDHHFHYGYFVRAAAEVCRIESDFCGPDQYGPMFELLIRDYAAGRDDPLFPYLRNFDPAFGFSWASGAAGFNRGNNNESTSEAANAYGAMVLYGLVTGNDEIAERGMYLHASTAASFWEYWNDIDGYRGVDSEKRNFPLGYSKITTSIIWGDGADFATWFSRRYAHILGIQGLPSNPLIMHVGLFADYLEDYVYLGMAESRKVGNGNPSGLPPGLWTDLWWNLWAMTDADSAIADYEATATYEPEAGEAPAHTYHWLYTMKALGELQTGTGALTADYPAAMAFETDAGVTSYVVYNFSDETIQVTFSDGTAVEAAPNAFAIEQL